VTSPDLAAATEVALVRHALPAIDGSVDPGLPSLGRLQSAAVAASVERNKPEAVWASHLTRACETAAPIAARLGLQVQIDEDLREWDPYTPQPFYRPPEALEGSLRGTAFAEGRFDEFLPPHDHVALQKRMAATLRRVAATHRGGGVVVVSHGGAINAFLALVVGTPSTFFFDPAYTGVSRVRVMPDGRFVLVSVNETAHLRDVEASAAP
jgi:broad specificity phosphatase PhoE